MGGYHVLHPSATMPLMFRWLHTLYQFSRPHTILGTTLSVLGLYVVAAVYRAGSDVRLEHDAGLLLGTLLATLAANVYIVGLNQLTDVEIDRINKPELPLAAGDLSLRAGTGLVVASLLLALVLALLLGRYLLLAVVLGMLVGTLYSLPPVRLKRFHVWAAASIFSVRGLVANLFLFLHFHTALGGAALVPPHVWSLTAFILALSLVIAWFKDVPDMAGDRRFRIATLSLRLGARPVMRLGLLLLAVAYVALALAALVALPAVNGPVLAALHAALLVLLWQRARRTDPEQPRQMARFYRFVWALFYAEYAVFPLACLLA
jgi:homogentisate phytyltransferase / homogentisate geranylgeranyltransferase